MRFGPDLYRMNITQLNLVPAGSDSSPAPRSTPISDPVKPALNDISVGMVMIEFEWYELLRLPA